jgi:hypothetical protein
VKVRYRPLVPADMLTVRQYMPFSPSQNTRGIVAYDPDEQATLAIFIAQEWTATSVQVHQVIIKPLVIRHGWFGEIAEWIFLKAARRTMYASVPGNNEKALALNKKLGFKEVVRLKDAYDFGVDFVIMELRREDVPMKFWKSSELEELAEVVNG